mgnify:CR=1 FL=1
MKLVVATKLNSLWREQIDRLRSDHSDLEITPIATPDDPSVAKANIIMGTMISEKLLHNAKELEAVAVPFAGINHLPLDLLQEKGVALTNAHANARYVAERVLALTMGALGKLVPFHEDLREERWHGFAVGESVLDSWDSLVGDRVAVLGAGAIGSWTAKLFKLFDCSVIGYRRTAAAAEYPYDEMTTDLVEAVRGAQVVVCALPLTKETTGTIDAELFAAMQGALFVNVGRGAVAEQKALYEALSSNTLRGAAIDTWYNYPNEGETHGAPANYPIHKLDNVLLSPHLGGYTPKAVAASIAEIFGKVDRYLRDGAFPEAVDLNRRY